jgi:hypothetical protein
MKIELKGLKVARFMSEETTCFTATVYIDGKKAGEARNDGHGGPTMIHPAQLRDTLDCWASNLPEVVTDMIGDDGKPFTYRPDAETIIDDLVLTAQMEGDLKRSLKNRVLYTRTDKRGIYQTKRLTPEQVKMFLSGFEKYVESWHIDKVLNALPFDQALAIYKAAA